jgi:ABC-2 type transport system permease protein
VDALAGDARDRDRRAGPVSLGAPTADDLDRHDRALLDRRNALLGLPVTVVSLGLLGLVLASTFVLYRQASAFSNLLEYPVWLATGLLVPLSLLPGWVEWLSWVLAPTWGMEAVRNAALGGEVWPGIVMCILLGGVYLVLGSFFMQNFERRARQQATLSLT